MQPSLPQGLFRVPPGGPDRPVTGAPSAGNLSLCPVCLKSSPHLTPSGPPNGPSPGTLSARSAATRTRRSPGSSSPSTRCRRSPKRPSRLGVRPARHSPPALSARHDHSRGLHLQGPRRAHPDQARTSRCMSRTPTRTPPTRGSPTPSPVPLDLRVVGPLVPDPRRPEPAAGAWAGSCELDAPGDAPRVRRPRGSPAAGHRAGRPGRRRPRCAWSAPSRSAAARATASSTRCAAAGVDAFLTADLRHHPASDAVRHSAARRWSTRPTGPPSGPGATQAAAELDEISDRKGWGLRTHVSRTVTDPWTAHAGVHRQPIDSGAPN